MIAFQSLFYWKSRSKSIEEAVGDFRTSSFNPYFIGKAVASDGDAAAIASARKFQSLFYWKSRSKRNSAQDKPGLLSLFQSLFYWKSRSKNLGLMRPLNYQLRFNPYFIGKAVAS